MFDMILDLYQSSIVPLLFVIGGGILLLMHHKSFLQCRGYFKGIGKRSWILLLVIFLCGLSLRLFVFPHYYKLYLDEPLNVEYAKNINNNLRPEICELNSKELEECWFIWQKPVAWPFLLSLVFKALGNSSEVAILLGNVIGSFSIIMIFFLSYLILGRQNVALWSAFLIAFTPLYVKWSNSSGANNPSLFFVLFTMIIFILYLKQRSKILMVLFFLVSVFTILLKFENVILVPILLLMYIASKKRSEGYIVLKKEFYPSLVVFFISILALAELFFINYFRINHSRFFMDLYFLNFIALLKDSSLYFIYFVLACMGVILGFKLYKEKVWLVAVPFLIYFTFYLPIYSEARMALIPGAFLIILSALALDIFGQKIKIVPLSGILLVLTFLIIFSMAINKEVNHILEKDSMQILETKSTSELKKIIPENCYIISEWPVVFTSISNIQGVSTKNTLENVNNIKSLLQEEGCFYYFSDMYCNMYDSNYLRNSAKRCDAMLDTFNLKHVKRFSYNGLDNNLFKIIE